VKLALQNKQEIKTFFRQTIPQELIARKPFLKNDTKLFFMEKENDMGQKLKCEQGKHVEEGKQ
jgi:hypothetical protein